MTTNTTTVATQDVSLNETYALNVKLAQKYGIECADTKTFKLLPPSSQTLINDDLTKRITAKKSELLGTSYGKIDSELQTYAFDKIRAIMAGAGIESVNIRITSDNVSVVKGADKVSGVRKVSDKVAGKFTYYVNGEMLVATSGADVAKHFDINTEGKNAWLAIAYGIKSKSDVTITRVNADSGVTEQFAPDATVTEKSQVWFTKL